MGYDLNNFWEHTKSQKIMRSNYLCNLIVETIDNNPLIRKFVRYSTYNPLANKSKNKNGEEIIQPSLKESLTINSVEGREALFNCAFNSNIKTEQDTTIYVYNPRNSFRGDSGELEFIIDVVVSNEYNDIINSDTGMEIKRGKAICSLIDDRLGEYIVNDDKYSKIVGNVKLKLIDQYEDRVAKNNDYIYYRMLYKVDALSGRVGM